MLACRHVSLGAKSLTSKADLLIFVASFLFFFDKDYVLAERLSTLLSLEVSFRNLKKKIFLLQSIK